MLNYENPHKYSFTYKRLFNTLKSIQLLVNYQLNRTYTWLTTTPFYGNLKYLININNLVIVRSWGNNKYLNILMRYYALVVHIECWFQFIKLEWVVFDWKSSWPNEYDVLCTRQYLKRSSCAYCNKICISFPYLQPL